MLHKAVQVKTLEDVFSAYLEFAEEFEGAMSLALMYVADEHRREVSLFLTYRALKYYQGTNEPLPRPIVEWFMTQIPREALERTWKH
jgi:hypothetical protein